ncbi:MAG TPA: biopolymer transporter ExbD [Terracidiphilus sp.]|nr:biopolymer transporter ExbD [Terracidiphilus sp.]
MTVSSSSIRNMTSEINVTPMIDVLLVLLIIFMVITPALPRGESAQVPQPPRNDGSTAATVVLEMQRGNDGILHFAINQQQVERKDLVARLAVIYANRAERVLFLKGDDQLSFTQVAEVIDLSHSVGVDRIGLLTPNVQAGR